MSWIDNFLTPLRLGQLILTPNHRLARFIDGAFDEIKQGESRFWSQCQVMALSAWLTSLYHSLIDKGIISQYLLTPYQEHVIWSQIIKQNPPTNAVINPQGLIKNCLQAYRLTCDWHVSYENDLFYLYDDSKAFALWAKKYDELCLKNDWISQAKLSSLISAHSVQLDLPYQSIYRYGFTEYTSSQVDLFSSIQSQEIAVTDINLDKQSLDVYHQNYNSSADEIEQAALWARRQSEAGKTVAIVVKDLEDRKDEIESAFRSVFEPERVLKLSHAEKKRYNISAGQMLIAFPVIKMLFLILKFTHKPLTIFELSELLHSPFIGLSQKEHAGRIILDTLLRDEGHTSFSLTQFVNSRHVAECTPGLKKAMASVKEQAVVSKNKQTLSHWSNVIHRILTEVAWPGERILDSIEYQVVNRFVSLSQEFALLDEFVGVCRFKQAVEHLKTLAGQTIFQPQSAAANVQVLGPLEAAGLPFDALWITGFSDDAWPSKASPNPFIPYQLQQSHNLPQSSAVREHDYAVALLTLMADASQQMIFSYATHSADIKYNMSALARQYPAKNCLEFYQPDTNIFDLLYNAKASTAVIEHDVPVNQPEHIKGGTWLLKAQSECPFKGFANYRLTADDIIEPEHGPNAMERGLIIHRGLELFWNQVKTQSKLNTLPADELRDMLYEVIDDAIKEVLPRPVLKQMQLIKVERECCYAMLSQWLQTECLRPSFRVIGHELETTCRVGPHSLKTKIDRVDQTATGETILIDYKTGQPSVSEWFGERLRSPQLPIYAVSRKDVSAVAFAVVRPEVASFKGISETDLEIEGVVEWTSSRANLDNITWVDLVDAWRAALEATANSFCDGYADVDPLNQSVCMYCDLQPLCRVNQ